MEFDGLLDLRHFCMREVGHFGAFRKASSCNCDDKFDKTLMWHKPCRTVLPQSAVS